MALMTFFIFKVIVFQAFFQAVATNERNHQARLLYEKFADQCNRAYLHFITPLLVDLRRITKLFQSKTANSLVIFGEFETFFVTLARRIIKPHYMSINTVYQLTG